MALSSLFGAFAVGGSSVEEAPQLQEDERVWWGDYPLCAKTAPVDPKLRIRPSLSLGALPHVLASALLHAAALGALAYAPALEASDGEPSEEQRYFMLQYFESAAADDLAEKETEQVAEAEEVPPTPRELWLREAARLGLINREAVRRAAEFGIVDLINPSASGDPDAPDSPWGAELLWGTETPAGEWTLPGIGEPIGPPVAALAARRDPPPRARRPQVRMTGTEVLGRLPPEVIQRIVRQNFGRFRLCYENNLQNQPSLQGRVSVRFVIGRDGRVSSVGTQTDMVDERVASCVARAFYGLSFPQPEGGIVTVTYPIMFSPGS